MNMLSIDTACSILSAAVSSDEKIWYNEADEGMKHSEIIMNLIDDLMKSASLKPDDLNMILCMGGPGSFTGLRIGYSIAKGLSLSLAIPFVPVPTLECIAWHEIETRGKGSKEIVLAVIESGKSTCYYAFFQEETRLTPYHDASFIQIAEDIEKFRSRDMGNIILTGPGAHLLYDVLPRECKKNLVFNYKNKGYAKEIIAVAKNKNIQEINPASYIYSGPEYIRGSV
jgi:tRNA threonylcarbamoyladenosine biosynthesis protein TsaB